MLLMKVLIRVQDESDCNGWNISSHFSCHFNNIILWFCQLVGALLIPMCFISWLCLPVWGNIVPVWSVFISVQALELSLIFSPNEFFKIIFEWAFSVLERCEMYLFTFFSFFFSLSQDMRCTSHSKWQFSRKKKCLPFYLRLQQCRFPHINYSSPDY